MSIAFLDSLLNRVTARTMPERLSHRRARRMRMSTTMATLFLVSALLLCASVATYSFRAALLAGSEESHRARGFDAFRVCFAGTEVTATGAHSQSARPVLAVRAD